MTTEKVRMGGRWPGPRPRIWAYLDKFIYQENWEAIATFRRDFPHLHRGQAERVALGFVIGQVGGNLSAYHVGNAQKRSGYGRSVHNEIEKSKSSELNPQV